MIKLKKNIFIVLAIIPIICGCGSNRPSESTIKSDLEDISYISQFVNSGKKEYKITEVSIDKRKKDKKEDIIYCIVELENDICEITSYLRLDYAYYDKGGWIVENSEQYKETSSVPIIPVNDADILSEFELQFQGVKVINHNTDLKNLKDTIELVVSKESKYLSAQGTIFAEYIFDNQYNYWRFSNYYNGENYQEDWKLVGSWSGDYANGYNYSLDITNITDDIAQFQCLIVTGNNDVFANYGGTGIIDWLNRNIIYDIYTDTNNRVTCIFNFSEDRAWIETTKGDIVIEMEFISGADSYKETEITQTYETTKGYN